MSGKKAKKLARRVDQLEAEVQALRTVLALAGAALQSAAQVPEGRR